MFRIAPFLIVQSACVIRERKPKSWAQQKRSESVAPEYVWRFYESIDRLIVVMLLGPDERVVNCNAFAILYEHVMIET
jgi:hypothetical protein